MDAHSNRQRSTPVIRALCAIALIATFIAVASYVRPQDSTAGPISTRELREIPAPAQPTQGRSLGWLESPEHRVQIISTADGPRYDVYNAEGVLIASGVDGAGLRLIDPAIDPASSLSTPLGLVTDDDL